MNKRFLLISLGVLSIATAMQARSRSAEEAKQVAAEFYQSQNGLRSASDVEFTLVYSGSENGLRASTGEVPFYVFNIGSADGFVMVSGDDRVAPVIGYSLTSAFNPDNMPSNLRGWLEGYEKQIEYARTLPDKPYEAPETRAGDAVGPLITTQWDQSGPYNNDCPTIGNEHALTGCVATAMAQIMNYHEWPASATGTGSYTLGAEGTPQSVNMSQFTFDWANMADTYDGNESADEQKAVAQLMAACGAGAQMQYGIEFSGAYDSNAAAAFIQNMGYDENVSFVIRDAYTNQEWIDLLKEELQAGRPILYGGVSGYLSGHAFVCDGYNTDNFFHINWGWSGVYNGYFNIDLLWPYETDIPGYNGFSYQQDAIIGIQKPTEGSVSHEQLFINSFFKESGNTFPQGDELSFTIFYQAGFAVPKKVQLAVEFRGMTLPATTYTYELEKDKEVNGTYSYFTLQFSDANFKLNPGDYEIFLRYRFNDNEEWIDAGWNHSAYNYHMALRATETDITWLGYNEYIEGTPIVLRATEDYRIFEATTTIRNNSTFEYHPLMSFLIVPEGEEPQHGILLENQGRLYLEAGEEQEFKVMFEQTLEPGNYSIYAVYRDNIYYAWLEETKIDFTIPEKTTANETISANDFSIRVYTDRIAVQSASTVRQIELYDISGRLTSSIRGANELPVDGLADGVYIVRVTTDEGVQTEKVILHR